MTLHAKITIALAILTRPAPDAIEHSAVKAEQKRLAENTALAGKGPCIGFGDVLLFEFVQLAAQGHVCRNEPVAFRWRDWRCVIVGVERVRHFSSQRRAGRRINSSISR